MAVYVGTRLCGYCAGYFGDDWQDKIIEGVGQDWLVVRGEENGEVMLATFRDSRHMENCVDDWSSSKPEPYWEPEPEPEPDPIYRYFVDFYWGHLILPDPMPSKPDMRIRVETTYTSDNLIIGEALKKVGTYPRSYSAIVRKRD